MLQLRHRILHMPAEHVFRRPLVRKRDIRREIALRLDAEQLHHHALPQIFSAHPHIFPSSLIPLSPALPRSTLPSVRQSRRQRRRTSRFEFDGLDNEEQKLIQQAIKNSKKDTKRVELEIPMAPTFYPTVEEFRNPYVYISKIRREAERYGICKIVPPPEWNPPTLLDMNNPKTFPTRKQAVHTLQEAERGFDDGKVPIFGPSPQGIIFTLKRFWAPFPTFFFVCRSTTLRATSRWPTPSSARGGTSTTVATTCLWRYWPRYRLCRVDAIGPPPAAPVDISPPNRYSHRITALPDEGLLGHGGDRYEEVRGGVRQRFGHTQGAFIYVCERAVYGRGRSRSLYVCERGRSLSLTPRPCPALALTPHRTAPALPLNTAPPCCPHGAHGARQAQERQAAVAREADAALRPPTERLVMRHGKLVAERVEPVTWRSDVEREFFDRMAKNLTKREQKLKVACSGHCAALRCLVRHFYVTLCSLWKVLEATTVKAVCTFKPTLPKKKRGEDEEEEEDDEDEEEGAADRRAVEAFMSRYQVP